MAGGNLSPRQKMINMMYLVLTALLALNVSKEILDSFVTVNNGLETTKGTLKEKMDATYLQFGQYASENKEKYGAAYAQAQEVQKSAADVMTYIDQIKARIIAETEGLPLEKVIGKSGAVDTILNLAAVSAKDNQDAITNIMIGSEPAKPKQDEFSGYDLRVRLEAFRDKIKTIAGDKNPTLVANVDRFFNFPKEKEGGDSGVETSWEVKNFYHVPLAAGVTILSKIQSDVRNAENECVNWMLGSVESKTFKFNTLSPMISTRSSYVTAGGSYEADIFLAAYDNQNAPRVLLGRVDTSKMEMIGEAQELPIGPDGKAKLKVPAAGVGEKEYTGMIIFKPVGGEEERHFFKGSYEVAQPNLVVSPTKMNVFYRGVDNPVDISVAGYSGKDIAPSVSNGSLSKAQQGYVVKPGKESESMVNVTVTNPDGTKRSMPGVKFRVKNVPNPSPFFGGKGVNDETIKKTELTAAQGVIAKMENFEFDLKFEIVEYTISMTVAGNPVEATVKGAAMSADAKTIFSKAKNGQKVYIERIKARGPDGTLRNLGSLSFKVVA
jgi:gliding motility-associated protein GldM